ncbi:uncharacterized protein LOC6564560 [Drosophila grimshawi]|uniref:GH11808 n=1 Tax=Drosophila grimshawi TaxID=7222 RepID=B4JIT3_DROGR|nr:uncharacterized protein LOC6564560 [Drosophila grimshawi]EDW00530.1 GH11808 [Drosophila grimshawi]
MMMTRATLPLLLLMIISQVAQLLAAPIMCGTDETEPSQVKSVEEQSTTTTPKPSEVNQFLHNVQCTLEKAKPWIEDLEKEAKRLEETAKRVGLSIVHRFGNLMDSILGAAANRIPSVTTTTTIMPPSSSTSTSTERDLLAAISQEPEQLTPSTESPLDNEIINVEPIK